MPGPPVAVVTDSTASLPAALAHAAGIAVVPLQVVLDGRPAVDDGALDSGELARALRSGGRATTSQPSPEAFARVYRRLVAEGAEAIVSVHLSGELSGTAHSAREAARAVEVPVDVVDSRTVALGTGFAARAAAAVAAGGGGAEEVAAAARQVAGASCVVFAVQDLAYLHRGGRIGATKLLVGSVLGARPVLRVADGRIGVAETVRGGGRAGRRLADLVLEAARHLGPAPVQVAVHHFDAPAAAEELADLVRSRFDDGGVGREEVLVAEVTAVVGVHTGPGVLGVVVAPALPSPG
jgi:DegV family protein with EDD domain